MAAELQRKLVDEHNNEAGEEKAFWKEKLED